MATEDQAVQEDTGSILPAVTALLLAAATMGARQRASRVAEEAAMKLTVLLTKLATSVVMGLVNAARSTAARQALLESLDSAVESAVTDGLAVAERSAQAVYDGVKKAEKSYGGVSKPGTVYEVDLPGESDEPEVVAHRIVGTTRNSARYHAAEEAEKGGYVMKKTWHSHKDTRVRATHAFLGDRSYEFHTIPVSEKFISTSGAALRFPKDPTAPFDETFRCRCWMTVR